MGIGEILASALEKAFPGFSKEHSSIGSAIDSGVQSELAPMKSNIEQALSTANSALIKANAALDAVNNIPRPTPTPSITKTPTPTPTAADVSGSIPVTRTAFTTPTPTPTPTPTFTEILPPFPTETPMPTETPVPTSGTGGSPLIETPF